MSSSILYSVPYLAIHRTYEQVCIKTTKSVYNEEGEIHICSSDNTTLFCVLLFLKF